MNEWTDEQRRQLEEAGASGRCWNQPREEAAVHTARGTAEGTDGSGAASREDQTEANKLHCRPCRRLAGRPRHRPPLPLSLLLVASHQPSHSPTAWAASPHSLSVLVGLGNGQLCLLSPLSSDEPAPLLLDAHAHAVVAVAWVGRSLISGNEYWLSAGSDKTIAVWRDRGGKGEAKREERVKDRGAGVAACGPVNGVDGLDRLVAVGLQGDVARLCCVWSVAHGWKVNSVSCQSSAAGIAVYVADVSHRVAVYRVT